MTTSSLVLVVEEVVPLRDALIAALEAEGWQVLTADDEAGALSILESRDVDLLVADPAQRGGVLDRVERAYPELPLVLLSETGPGSGVYFGPWATSGSRRTLRRPFKLSDVIAAVRQALGETVDS